MRPLLQQHVTNMKKPTIKPGTIVNIGRPDKSTPATRRWDARILRLLCRRHKIEAEHQELERELREISRELFERRNGSLFAEIAKRTVCNKPT